MKVENYQLIKKLVNIRAREPVGAETYKFLQELMRFYLLISLYIFKV